MRHLPVSAQSFSDFSRRVYFGRYPIGVELFILPVV